MYAAVVWSWIMYHSCFSFHIILASKIYNHYSGNTPDHCSTGPMPTPPPTPPPVPPTPTTVPAPSPLREDDSRLIAYLGNWQSCPTTAQVAHYTHIVIAFAVSYTWSPSKNICSATCEIAEPPICNNSPNPGLVSEWQAAGKKVIVSFGGKSLRYYVARMLTLSHVLITSCFSMLCRSWHGW